jgi:hypothetical protein
VKDGKDGVQVLVLDEWKKVYGFWSGQPADSKLNTNVKISATGQQKKIVPAHECN